MRNSYKHRPNRRTERTGLQSANVPSGRCGRSVPRTDLGAGTAPAHAIVPRARAWSNRRPLGAAIAAAALVLVPGCSDDDDPEQNALSVVGAAYDSFNDGDVDTWVEIRDRGSAYPSEDDRATNLENERVDTAAQFEAGERIEGIQCESQGEGEWPVADEGNVAGYYITCDTSLVGAQGLIIQETYEWVVQDGDVVAVRSNP